MQSALDNSLCRAYKYRCFCGMKFEKAVTDHILTRYPSYQSDLALIKLIAATSCIAFCSIMLADIPNAVIILPSTAYGILWHDSTVRGVIPMPAESAYFSTHFYIEPSHHLADLPLSCFLGSNMFLSILNRIPFATMWACAFGDVL